MRSSTKPVKYAVLATALLGSALLVGCSSHREHQNVAAAAGAPVARHHLPSLEPIRFSSGSSYVEGSQQAKLDAAAEAIKGSPNTLVYVDGYTDASPFEEGNPWLANVRADQVAYELEQRGVPYYQLVTRGFGDAHPTGSNDSAKGRAKNRRVDLVPAS